MPLFEVAWSCPIPAKSHLRTWCALFTGLVLAACSADATRLLQPDSATAAARRRKPAIDTASVVSTNALAGATFWVDPYSNAKQTADSWRPTRPTDAADMDKIAAQPQARWFGNWNTDIYTDVNSAVTMMSASGAWPLLVAYNIPQRDCGGLSGGNSVAPDAYRTWIADFARGIGPRRAVVVLEPDALAAMDCLSSTDQQVRLDLLSYAVQVLAGLGRTLVYIDAGNPQWHTPSEMATRLSHADVAGAAGFSLNVSNFFFDSDNVAYGQSISALTGGKHFIIDSGRNGLGPTADNQWCNPDGRALGTRPTVHTGNPLVDAFLWIKNPGESDGACNGAPAAGTWMPRYALGLAQRAAY